MNRRCAIRGLSLKSLPFLTIASFAACATSTVPSDGEADAGLINTTQDGAPLPDAPAPDAAPVSGTLSQLTSDNLVDATSVVCNLNNVHSENSWYRIFDLSLEGVVGDFDVEKVTFGVQSAASGNGSNIPVNVRVHTLSGTFTVANLTQVGTASTGVANQNLTKIEVPLTATVPANSLMVVEIHAPDGEPAGHSFWIGGNNLGQRAPSYVRAPDCDFTEPVSVTQAGFPDSHLYITVTGSY